MSATPTAHEIARALRVHFAEHNRRVALIAVGTLAVSLVAWAALYFVAQWLALLFVTVVSEGTAPMPRGVAVVFAAIAASLLAYAWIDRRLRPDERPRDMKSFAEIAADMLLALPRATLGAWSTLTARQHLSDGEIALAADFLARLAAVGRLSLSAAGYDLPDPAARERVLFALQITGVIDVLHGKDGASVLLSAQHPSALGLSDVTPASRR